jgi:hypothetical protein
MLLQQGLNSKCDRLYSKAWLGSAMLLQQGLNSKCDACIVRLGWEVRCFCSKAWLGSAMLFTVRLG